MSAQAVELIGERGANLHRVDRLFDSVEMLSERLLLRGVLGHEKILLQRQQLTISAANLGLGSPPKECRNTSQRGNQDDGSRNEYDENPTDETRQPERQIAIEKALTRFVKPIGIIADSDRVVRSESETRPGVEKPRACCEFRQPLQAKDPKGPGGESSLRSAPPLARPA